MEISANTDVMFYEKRALGLIVLNRPQALNALSHEMIVAIYQQLGEWTTNPAIKAVAIKSASDKAFCVGGDIRKVYQNREHANADNRQFFWDEYRLNHRIYHYPKPYIALLDGYTMGGGVGVSFYGSHRIVTERFAFAMPEVSIGFFPDIGSSYLLSRCPGQSGIYLGLTGERINASDAMQLKLATHFVPSDQLQALANALESDVFANDPQDRATELIQQFASQPTEPGELTKYYPHIDVCFAHQTIENILSSLETHRLEWCHKIAAIMKTKSPLSLKIVLHELRHGAMLTFDQCLQTEYRLVVRFLEEYNFYEGIRAVLIDKDHNPIWKPAELSAINETEITNYFAPLPKDIPELSFT